MGRLIDLSAQRPQLRVDVGPEFVRQLKVLALQNGFTSLRACVLDAIVSKYPELSLALVDDPNGSV